MQGFHRTGLRQRNLPTGAGRFTVSRNAGNGLPVSVSDGTLHLARTFSGYGETESQTVTAGTQNLSQISLTRDNAGRITGKTETVGGITSQYVYTYDASGRLLTVTKDGVLTEEYRYSANGSRIYEMNTLRGTAGRTLNYSAEDHLLTAGGVTYTYSPDGFLTAKTAGSDVTAYDYSSRGELLGVTLPGGTSVEYVHEPLGRRIAKKINGVITEKYLWSGLTTLLAVYDGSNNLIMRFEYADSRLPFAVMKAGVLYYPVYDQVGSLKLIADSSGNVVKRIEYDTFGNIINDTNPGVAVPFGFAGGLHDRLTGLVRFGCRDYDPDTGRWTAKDPIGFAGGDTDLYGYCVNDPVNGIDPSGLFENHWNDIRMDRSKGEIYYKGYLYAFRMADGNWHEATLEPDGKIWPGGFDSEDVIVNELINRLEKDDLIDSGLGAVSVCAAGVSLASGAGTPAMIATGVGFAVDSVAAVRSNDPTQVAPDIAGLFGKKGQALGFMGSVYNFMKGIFE